MPPKFQIPPNAKFQPQNPKFVGNDTDSADPNDIRSRLFVGCLNLEVCTRNDIVELFSMYGPLKGVTHFVKGGYAFVQYENEQDAEDAILNLNRYVFHGIRLDVKIAQKDRPKNCDVVSGRAAKGPPPAHIRNPETRKRGPNEISSSGRKRQGRIETYDSGNSPEIAIDSDNNGLYRREQLFQGYVDPYAAGEQSSIDFSRFGKAAQRVLPEQECVEEEEAQEENSNNALEDKEEKSKTEDEKRRELNQKRVESIKQQLYKNVDDEEGSVLDPNDIPDLLICGGCHLITSSAEFFCQHRQRPCDRRIVTKHADEPRTFSCFHCNETLRTSWELLEHLGRKHKICLYKESEPQTFEYPPLFAD